MPKVYLECSLSLDCYELLSNGLDRSSARTRDRLVWNEWKKKEGFCWFMFKHDPLEVGDGPDQSALHSLLFCSTSTSTEVPTWGLDLLMPFMDRLRNIWTDNVTHLRTISNSTVSDHSA